MQALGLVWGAVDGRASDYREHMTVLDAPRHPGANLVLSVWQRRTKKDRFIVGRDVPSRALSSVLRNLAIYEPIEDGRDFRVRVAGTAFYRRFDRDVTGECFSELFDRTVFEKRRARLWEVAEGGGPFFLDIERGQGSRPSAHFELVLLPVWAPDCCSRWVLAGIFFHDWVR